MRSLTPTSKYKLSLKSIGINKAKTDVYILNFNYTNTCEMLYNEKFEEYCNLRIKPVYVHGKINFNDNCSLVLGTQTFENIDNNKDGFSYEFNVFKKHYQRHKYQTIEPYQDLVRKVKKSKSVPNFHIIGHSLDKTDHNILKHILLSNDDAVINIYYHNNEAQKSLMDNINKIIGEYEVISKVRFIHQHEDKRSILKNKSSN